MSEDIFENESGECEEIPTDEEEIEFEGIYNRHYIKIREDGALTDAWSDGPHPGKDTAGAVCINDRGGYQLRLRPGGEENPNLYTFDGIPLYKWGGEQVVPRAENEIEFERATIPMPPPSAQEQLRADVDFIAAMTGVRL